MDIEFEKENPNENTNSTNKDNITKETNIINNTNTTEDTKLAKENQQWRLEIPSINLNAPIAEGTTNEVIDNYVGHFSETAMTNGNIGLVAHNRGYKHNYFENLKKLKIGDIIIYTYYGKTVKYQITVITIIKDTDWSYLQKTQESKMTLITCVENQPEYRRCIQAIEMEES